MSQEFQKGSVGGFLFRSLLSLQTDVRGCSHLGWTSVKARSLSAGRQLGLHPWHLRLTSLARWSRGGSETTHMVPGFP